MIQDPQFDSIPITRKADLLGVNRKGYYKWLTRPPPNPEKVREDVKIRDEMQKIAIDFPGYGYRRITVDFIIVVFM